MKLITVLMITVLFSACSQKPAPKESKTPPKPSTIQTAVEGLTGQTAVKQGKKAQEQIIDISNQQNRELDEVLQ